MASQVELAFLAICRRAVGLPSRTLSRRFKSLFGVSILVANQLWYLIGPKLLSGAKPGHLLFGLVFLKNYTTEHVQVTLLGVDEKTSRKWQWYVVTQLSSLDLVSTASLFLATN